MTDGHLSKGEQRRQQMLHLLKQTGRISVQEMMERFDCSEATVRRDLDLLEKTAGVIRTVGGAIYDGFLTVREASFTEKKEQLWVQKEAIAAKAVELIEEGDSICLSGGTTTYLIARELKRREGITEVTNAVNIAMELADSEGIQVVVIGGVMRSKSYELAGPLAERMIEQLHIGKMFLGLDGLTPEQGLTTYSELEAQTARMLISRSRQTFAVFDHTKLGKTSLFSIAPLTELQGCVTDEGISAEAAEQLRQQGLDLHVAKLPKPQESVR